MEKIECLKRVGMMLLGSVFATIGLRLFLIPNHLLDGGVTGISIIAAHLTDIPLGIYLILFNLPFMYLGYKKIGPSFAVFSAIGTVLLALMTYFIHPDIGFTQQPILAAVFGGMMVGLGLGTAIRYGGTLDGADTVAVLIDRVTSFSVGEAIMVINVLILTASGFVFGWDRALFSIIAYFVAHKAIDVTVQGLNENRSVWVVSRHYRKIGDTIEKMTGRKVTYFKDNSKDGIPPRGIILSVITRFEENRIKRVIHSVDKKAFVVIANTHEIIGKNFTR